MSEQTDPKPDHSALIAAVAVVGAAVWLWHLFGGEAGTLRTIQYDVAKDFERQYDMVKISGTPIDLCVRAGLVAEGYLQANDTTNYRLWKGVERRDCTRAGIWQN